MDSNSELALISIKRRRKVQLNVKEKELKKKNIIIII